MPENFPLAHRGGTHRCCHPKTACRAGATVSIEAPQTKPGSAELG